MGFGSLLMDTSSELVHSLLPVFMVTTLGVGMITVGVVEGVAEATASFLKVFAGALSDRLRHRKWLMVAGYALSALSKPLFPLASSIGPVAAARFADRVGKGIRGAPRDALIADITEPAQRGTAYGLRQALDSVGALCGPALAVVLLGWASMDVTDALWFSVVPAVGAVLVLAAGTREPQRPRAAPAPVPALRLRGGAGLPARFWRVAALGAVFTLARFSEAFLVLRGQDAGLSVPMVPVVMIAMSGVYALAAYPAGIAADRGGARTLLLAGLAVLVAADLVLAFARTPAGVLAGAAAWGLHMGLTQGLMSKLVSDAAPPERRATAFGVFNLVGGVATLLASAIAGALWHFAGAPGTFLAGAAFAATAATGLAAARPAKTPA
jgi:MFS family permease